MKVIWYKQSDGTWSARHYPRGIVASAMPPLQLLVRKDGDEHFPWYWEVVQQGEIIRCGYASDKEDARLTAHGQMAQHLYMNSQ